MRVYKAVLQQNNLPIVRALTGDAVTGDGDIVWLDYRLLAVGRGYRTNEEGIKQLKAFTHDSVDESTVIDLPHKLGTEVCFILMFSSALWIRTWRSFILFGTNFIQRKIKRKGSKLLEAMYSPWFHLFV